jgi:hypothetical protein
MVFFRGGDAASVAVRYCGTAKMLQEELQRLRNNHLPSLKGTQVVVGYRKDASSTDTFVITFSHKDEMGCAKEKAVRDIVQAEAFQSWLQGVIRERHGWGNLRVRVTNREKPKEYVWSVERRDVHS